MAPTVQRVRELVVSYRPYRCQLPAESTVALGDRLTVALAAQRKTLARDPSTCTRDMYQRVPTVRTVRAIRERGELLGIARLDVLIVTNPAKGVHA